MFRFNFSHRSEETAENTTGENLNNNASQSNETKWIESKEVFFADSSPGTEYTNRCNACLRNTEIGNTTIKYMAPHEIINFITNSDSLLLQSEQENSDLLTAIYEGGLKLWNGTFDILEYVNRENMIFTGLNILDLGCGNGLIGLYALLNGAANVTFQDYNEEVIKYITIPNTQVNFIPNLHEKCRFFTGDWLSFSEKLPQNSFDFILTADTIYNSDNYEKLHAVFQNLLKKTGKIFLAAKTIYFGLSGTVRKFEAVLAEKEVFESRKAFSIMDGIEREILEIKFRSDITI